MSATFFERLYGGCLIGERAVPARLERRTGEYLVLQLARSGNQRKIAFERAPDQHAGNQQAVDLVCALENAIDARVPVVPLGRVVLHEPVAAVYLNVLVEHELQRLASCDFRDRRFDRELFHRRENGSRSAGLFDSGVDEARCSIEQALDGVGLHGHLGELVLDGAKRGDRFAELPACRRVPRALADGRVAATHAHGAELVAPEVKDVERDLVAFADLAKQIRRGDVGILQNQRSR